ncbi:MAG: DUF362 domain-containing protein [Bacteroidota bacterium]
MGQVSIAKVKNDIRQSVISCFDNIGGLQSYLKPEDHVLLKPNINGTEAVTNIKLVEALLVLLKDIGIKQIVIAESTFGDAKMTDLCFSKTGYSDLAKKHQTKLINLNKSRKVKVKVQNPLVVNEVSIAEDVFEASVIINIPVMKVHYATAITLSLKNLKGFLVGDEKRRFHEIGLDKAIVDLNNAIAPTLNLIDCTTCMEKMGPRGGDTVNLNLLVAGCNRGEVDYVGSQIMGFALNEVKHLQYFIESKGLKIDDIVIMGEKLKDVRRPFVKVSMNNSIPKSFQIYNTNACSSCMNAFLLSCQFLENEDHISADIFMGDKFSAFEINDRIKIAFGNCCKEDTISFNENIIGCPPYPFALKKALEKRHKTN